MVRARRFAVALITTAVLCTAACSSDGSAPPAPETPTAFTSYVAMGDSAVAGPDLSPSVKGSGPCARSKANWPSLLAETLEIESFKDVSCSGAVSADIVTGGRVQPKAQINALSADTDLVTISIGGNDEGLFSKIVVSCLANRFGTDTCKAFIETNLAGIIARTTARVTASLEQIKKNAPNARIVMVGYLRILPEKGGCTIPGVNAARIQPAVTGMNAMTGALEAAARAAKVEYVSMAGVSVGHEACAGANAWVNGLQSVPGDGALLHPNSSGMHAVARTVADQLDK